MLNSLAYNQQQLGALSSVRELKVYEPSASWLRQAERWQLMQALQGGTLEMQRRGKQFLPQEPREDEDAYRSRLARSVCPPYAERLISMLAGMLTRKPIRLDNVPDVIREHLFDTDLSGSDLNIFIQQIAKTCIRYGHVGVLVDYPRGDEGDDTPVTDFSRPYWLEYPPSQILGWRTDVINGAQKLTQLRLHEQVVVPYGEFGEEQVEQVRVLEPGGN